MSNEKTKEADREFLLTRMHYYNRHPNKNQRDMDIFPIFTSPRATKIVIDDFVAYIRANYDVHKEVGVIVGPEAEGFLFGPLVAMQLGLPFAPARKQRKLPGDIVRERYAKWSSTDALEMQICAFDDVDIAKGAIIVDDSGEHPFLSLYIISKQSDWMHGSYITKKLMKSQWLVAAVPVV